MMTEEEFERIFNDVYMSIFGTGLFSKLMCDEIEKRNLKYEDLKILEVGCGCGKLGYFVATKGADYQGFDIDRKQIFYAELIREIADYVTRRRIGDVYYYEDNIFEVQEGYGTNYYDVVFNEGFLEHFDNKIQEKILKIMMELSKNLVMIFVPDKDNPIAMKRAQETTHNYKGMPEKEYPLSRDELKILMEKAGLKNVEIKPCNEMIFGVGEK